ncbi:MAG: ScyD/ScyE family protein [Geodermatophilaceae bacterium]|nr:ScyD/ScyE family protein [Geodermatophilaceae bacterium]
MNSRAPGGRAVVIAAALALAVGAAAPANAAGATGTVSDPLVSGLIGPLGLDVTANGTIYVAEGFAGRITRVLAGGARTVLYEAPGDSVAGVTSTGQLGRVVITLSTFPEQNQPPTDTTIALVRPNGSASTLASLLDHEVSANPDGGQEYGFTDLPAGCLAKLPPELQPYSGAIDSNPYKIAALTPYTFAVADAAGNSVNEVVNGTVTTVAVLPPIPQRIQLNNYRKLRLPACTVGHDYLSEPVPTDVEVGPDGYWYVSALPGGPELPGYGSVYRVNPDTGGVSLLTRGLSGAVDLAVAEDGTIYVAELNANKITAFADGALSTVAEVFSPGAVEIAPDGTIYATVGVFDPRGGDVVTITP